MTTPFRTFELVQAKEIPSLKIRVEEYEHTKTGAKHYHLASDNTENVCMAAVRTLPMDSTGIPHILEHTALCGSEKYNVRDPFFTMLKRSNNTFMNAFTSSDWTAYPFASETPKDFDNLMSVYLDATFFSNLDEMDFRQEGWRLDFEEEGNTESPLVYKGVVFNEMKGAMSPSDRRVAQDLDSALYQSTTYHYNSGGEPKNIPDLSYQELLDFRNKYYHPSNTMFMTYGDRSAAELQEKFEEDVLQRFERSDEKVEVIPETPFAEPRFNETRYAKSDLAEDGCNDYVVLGWLVGDTTNLREKLRMQLLDMVLMHDSASPLLKALETTDLGKSPFKYGGLGTEARDMIYAVGLEGVNGANHAEVERLVFDALKEVADNGVSEERLEALLHQLEIDSRNLEGGGYPLGLRLCLQGLAYAVHRADITAAYDLEAGIEQLRKDIHDPEFIKNLVKEKLIENKTRVLQVSKADAKLAKEEDDAEKARLAKIKEQILATEGQAGLDAIAELNAELKSRQLEEEDVSCLPKVELSDLRDGVRVATAEVKDVDGMKVTMYDQPTNGLIYMSIISEMPKLTERQQYLMPYYAGILDELGLGENTYEEVAAHQTAVASVVHGGSHTRTAKGDVSKLDAFFSISGSGLARNKFEIADLIQEMLYDVRFDEHSRIKEFLQQVLSARLVSVVNNGHASAMCAARSMLVAESALSQKQGGLDSVVFLKNLVAEIEDSEKLASLAKEFEDISLAIQKMPRQVRVTGEKKDVEELSGYFTDIVSSLNVDGSQKRFDSVEVEASSKGQLWITNTQVNYCAKAYKAVDATHKDAPALQILSQFMRDGFLHTAVREQGGAYGGGASFHADTGTFAFFSYRDPRMAGTLEDFDRSVEWMVDTDHSEESLEQAILGVVSTIDSPQTPAALASSSFWNNLNNRSESFREEYRSNLLKVTLDDLKRVAAEYLVPEKGAVAVVTNADYASKDEVAGLNLQRFEL